MNMCSQKTTKIYYFLLFVGGEAFYRGHCWVDGPLRSKVRVRGAHTEGRAERGDHSGTASLRKEYRKVS